MKKTVLLILLASSLGFSQQKMALVYKVTSAGFSNDLNDGKHELIREYIIQGENELNDLTYTLQIDNKKSNWFLNNRSSFSNAHMGISLGGESIYFFDFISKQYIEQRLFLDNYFIVHIQQKNFSWELLPETKQILGYTCYKAVSKEVKVINGENKTFYTTAWYAPELKYSIGPRYFGGLEGLILELTNAKIKYYCTEIFSPEKMPMFIIEKPSKGKVVSEEEYLNEMNKLAEERGYPTTKN